MDKYSELAGLVHQIQFKVGFHLIFFNIVHGYQTTKKQRKKRRNENNRKKYIK